MYFKHGQSHRLNNPGTLTWRSWHAMRMRCRHRDQYYRGRGITVCERWEDFENFLADMGDRPVGKTLDRIDPNKGYSPENCRWATAAQQSHNRRDAKLNPETVLKIVALAENYTRRELGHMFNIAHQTVTDVVLGKRWSSVTGIIYNRKAGLAL